MEGAKKVLSCPKGDQNFYRTKGGGSKIDSKMKVIYAQFVSKINNIALHCICISKFSRASDESGIVLYTSAYRGTPLNNPPIDFCTLLSKTRLHF